MKKTLLLLLFFVGLSSSSPRESEFQEKKFYVPAIAYSQYPCLDNVLTQATFIK
jgi:hypothetical protein